MSRITEFFEVSKNITSKTILLEYAYKIYNTSKDIKTLFDNMTNKLNLI